MHPLIALTAAGVLMDVVGGGFEQFTEAQRNSVVEAFPRGPAFEEEIIQTFYDWNKHKPQSVYATINADVLAEKDRASSASMPVGRFVTRHGGPDTRRPCRHRSADCGSERAALYRIQERARPECQFGFVLGCIAPQLPDGSG